MVFYLLKILIPPTVSRKGVERLTLSVLFNATQNGIIAKANNADNNVEKVVS